MAKIRKGTTRDFEAILDMAREFWGYTSYTEPFDRESVLSWIKTSHDHGLLVVLEKAMRPVGFAAAILSPLLGNRKVFMATEIGYWINVESRGFGRELLVGLEEAAREVGASYMNMVALQTLMPKRAEHLYEKAGYQKAETLWMKEL